MPLILTGRYWNGKEPIEVYTRNAYLSGSMPLVFKKMGYHVGLFPFKVPDILFSRKIASNFVRKKGISIAQWSFLLDLSLFRQLPNFLIKMICKDQAWFLSRHFDDPYISRPGRKRKPVLHKKTYSDLNQDRQNIEAFEAGIGITDRPVFKYLHWNGLHRPLARNENCEYESMEFNRSNYIRQAKCVLRLVDRFLFKLRETGIYEKSLIFVIGDHGVVDEKIGILCEKNPDHWKLDDKENSSIKIRQAAIPLLLVKRFAAAQAEMKISDAPADIGDIPSTVFAETGIKNEVPGLSLFELKENQRRFRPFYLVIGRVPREFELKQYLVDGFSWLPSSWPTMPEGEDFSLGDD